MVSSTEELNAANDFKIVEKNEDESKKAFEDPVVSKEIVADLLHSHDIPDDETTIVRSKTKNEKRAEELELEIKSSTEKKREEKATEPKEKTYENLPPYEPTLDLRDYKYPTLDLLETHGSEKIIQDPAGTWRITKIKSSIHLKNYDIEIQKISARWDRLLPCMKLFRRAGIRISRIKNLEDDIALSLAALGIRIIAPIPGKGTIGIEVPNVRKSVVSMKTLLGSEKFQHNNYSLPIAIGKKIDNDNFIVDLASMPHLSDGWCYRAG